MRRSRAAGVTAGCLALAWASAVARAQPGPPPPPPPQPPQQQQGYAPEPAQAPAPAPSSDRTGGVLVGGGLGIGSMAFQVADDDPEEYDDSFALQLWFGGMISPRLALGVEMFTTTQTLDETFDEGAVTIHQRNFGAFLRFWLLRRLWLQGGLNSARAIAETDFDTESISGFGLSGVAGFEILSRRKWSLDIALRLSAASYREDSELKSQSVALTANFNFWFL